MKCVLPYPAFNTGETAIIYLYDLNLSASSIIDILSSSTVILVQIHGHLQVNERWVKLSDKLSTIINEEEEYRPQIDHVQVIPIDPRLDRIITSSGCIFSTSKVPVSPQHITDRGVFLEFMIPKDLLSSYKSRSMNVDYYVTVYVQSVSLQKIYHFPFTIHSLGTAASPYYTRFSSLAVYPVNSIPIDRVLSNELNLLSNSGDSSSNFSGKKSASIALQQLKSFNVRDKGHICVVHLPNANLQIGRREMLVLDFEKNEQECFAIKASIILLEKQNLKDSMITLQEKVVCCVIKYTEDAEEIIFPFLIPSECCYSFVSPILQVEYQINLDFYLFNSLQKNPEEQSTVESSITTQEPLSFSIPIEVNSFDTQLIIQTPPNQKKFSLSELQNLCLQSRHSKIGIIEFIETST